MAGSLAPTTSNTLHPTVHSNTSINMEYLEIQRLQNLLVSASRYGAEEAVRTMGLAPQWFTRGEAIKRVGRPAFERALKNRTITPAYTDGSTRAVYPAMQVNALYSALDLAAIIDTTTKRPGVKGSFSFNTGLLAGNKGTGIPSNPTSKASKNACKI